MVGGEWFGGVITKGREEKVNVDMARSQTWLSPFPLVRKAASFQVAVLQLASCRGDKRLARVLIVRYK